MTKFAGNVGYGVSIENPTDSGVWVDDIVEHFYYGDVIKSTRKLDGAEKVNDDISVGNSIRIVADEYANQHFFNIKYVIWQGQPWRVTNVEAEQGPRMVLSLGEIYNGPLPEVDDS